VGLLWGLCASAIGALGCNPRAPALARPAATPQTEVLVTIVVDQLAAWIAAERWPELPPEGGFARLRREGLYVRELRYQHAVTDTAPGHSALYTGAVPRVSGIFGNEVIEPRADGRGVEARSILADPGTRLLVVGVVEPSERIGSSLAALDVETVADVLVAHRPGAQVFSFSLKDRGALFAAGRHPTLALWFDPALEAFVSSTAVAASLPAWVAPVAGTTAVRAARAGAASSWTLLDRAWVEAHAETPDDQPGEGDYEGLGTTFPHPIASSKAMRATPLGDGLLLSLARGALAQAAIGHGPGGPLWLALSLSSNDYIGHAFGPHSWEAWDELRRLDHRLSDLLSALDRQVGPDRYAVMLTGDHGINGLPELADNPRDPWCRRGVVDRWERGCARGRRLEESEVAAALEETLEETLDETLEAELAAAAPAQTAENQEAAAAATPAPTASPSGPGPAEKPVENSAPAAPGPATAPIAMSSPARAAAHRWVAGIADPLVFLTARARALPPADHRRLVEAAARVLRDRFGIDDVVDVHAATAPCPPFADESPPALVCRSLRPDGPGDLYLVVHPRTFFDPGLAPGHGASHGSPYLYDRAVPLLVRAPGRVAAGSIRETPVWFTAFARTAAALLQVPPPAAAAEGEDLTQPP
jgi:hypothetical protein